MKISHTVRSLLLALAVAAAVALPSRPLTAQQTDISQIPLGTASGDTILPNLMFILDDSGSMSLHFMPDNVADNNTCKQYTSTSGGGTSTACMLSASSDLVPTPTDEVRHLPFNVAQSGNGDTGKWTVGPPGQATQFNTVYYDPQITYLPGKTGLGADMPSFESPWTSVQNNPYAATPGTFDLTTQYPEAVFCTASNSTPTSTTNCRRNGYNSAGTALLASFRYSNASTPTDGSYGWPIGTGSGAFRFVRIRFGAPHFYTILPREHCSDINLTTCTLSATPTGSFTLPAPVRYCQDATMANADALQSGLSGSTPRCQAKLDGSHAVMRYGTFVRTDIVPTVTTYGGRPSRTDCNARPVCTYAEEMTNFANWHAYYHTRMQAMKTAGGRVFAGLDDSFRVGFVTINASSATRYLKIDKFEPVHKANWYTKFYAMTPSGGTPLREALSRVGRHYGGINSGINSFMPDDPIQYSCQKNFALLTTDGYWNGNAGQNLTGGSIGDQDDTESTASPFFVTRAGGTLDGFNTQVTSVTRKTETAQVICSGNTTQTTFSTTAGGTNVNCGCSATTRRIRQRVHVWDETVVTTDGVPAAPTTANVSNTHSTVVGSPPSGTAGGGCVVILLGPTLTPAPTTTNSGAPNSTTAVGGSSNTLADVAMYYYKTDLRTTGPLSKTKNNVKTQGKLIADHQHMITFTVGLGLDGLMNYKATYETEAGGDFDAIRSGLSNCSWLPGKTCNWPVPAADAPSALDDLWHAAVNGRGTYFSAKEPNTLQTGLTKALSAIKIEPGAAASSATSTPNITPSDNFIYSSTYRTIAWDGEVVAERIDVVTGGVLPGVAWNARTLLNARVAAATDSRNIYTLHSSDAGDGLKEFRYALLDPTTEQLHFDNRCGIPPAPPPAEWPQCGPMSDADRIAAGLGNNLVNWLRGQTQHQAAPTAYYRHRDNTLGDTVNAKPAFVGKPILIYGDAGYDAFKASLSGRTAALYISANDGMLHAFNSSDTSSGGEEMWAYVPRMLLPDLYKLAAQNYGVNHRYFVDGSPATMDVFIGGAWKTILVGGLNAGGRGYYALDVTRPDPAQTGGGPKGLWEICSDASRCAISDPDMGFSYTQPVITKLPNGTWVVIVASGYNNVLPGDGGGYLYVLDAATGAILHKAATTLPAVLPALGGNVGTATTPSGLAKIIGFSTNFAVNNTTTVIYGGDLLGNIWRFDLATLPAFPAVGTGQRLGQALDAGGKPQSITTRPDVTCFDPPACIEKVLYFGTGRFLGESDLGDPAAQTPPLDLAYQQSVYGIRDTGADLGTLRAGGAGLVQQVLQVIDSTSRTISNNGVDWDTQNGWYVDLNPTNSPAPPGGDSPGERVTIDVQLVRGVLLVAANEPNDDACSSGGNSFVYQFDYRSGSYVPAAPGNVVGTKFGTALLAGFVVYRLPSGQLKYTGIDVTGVKDTEGVLPGSGGSLGRRTGWRELY